MKEKKEMTQEREADILERAVINFGFTPQIIVAIEEMSELTKALTKHLRNREDYFLEDKHKEHVAPILEEMADVYIMLNQLSLIFGDPTEWEIAKLERLEDRLRNIPDACKGRDG